MSISGISSSTNIYQDPVNLIQSLREDLSGLATKLASGGLTAAQKAFATLTQALGNTSPPSGQQTGATSQLSTDLTTLGTALTSGDVAAAQKAFATFTQDLKTGGLHHHHHHHRHTGSTQNTTGDINTDLTTLGTALNSGDLTGARQAFATLLQDLGNTGTQSTSATNSINAQSATNGQSNTTSSLLDALQAANGTSQNGSASSVNTLFQAQNLYAQVGQFNLKLPTTGLFSTTG